MSTTKAPRVFSFRGSITRPLTSLSTLRRMGRPATTQDSLLAAGPALPGGIVPAGFQRKVSEFKSLPPLQSLPDARTSLNSTCLTPKPLASSIYVHFPEAPSPRKRAMSATSLFPSSWMVSPLRSWNGVSGVLRTIFLLKQSPTWAMYPLSSRGDWVLAPRGLTLQRGEIDPVEYWGSSETWLTPFEIKPGVPLYASVRNRGPSGIRARARFLENDKPDVSDKIERPFILIGRS
jgi:hypothetical protein